jgi:hypothetical protein
VSKRHFCFWQQICFTKLELIITNLTTSRQRTLPMKTVHQKTVNSLRALLATLLLFTTLVATAQPDYHAGKVPAKGYWKLQTDYATRNTIIRFFNDRDEPVYQETIMGKYIKLTKRNIRLFDEMLNRVVNSELLASQVKAYDLVATNDFSYSSASANYKLEETPAMFIPEDNKGFMANPWITKVGKLRVNFANPGQKKVQIELTDEMSEVIYYSESSHLTTYVRYLDTRHLSSGKYRLQLKSPDRTLTYWVKINKPYHEYELTAAK